MCVPHGEKIMRSGHEKFKTIWRHRMWIWFILTSIIISLLVMLFSGSLQIKWDMHADATFDEFCLCGLGVRH